MNHWRTYVLTLAIFAPFGLLWAQSPTAEDYFNQAGRQYVKEDKLAALKTLDRGLQAFPGDARLLKLAEELIKEQQDKQQQQQQQKQDQQQQDQQGEKEKQQQQEEQKQSEENEQAKQQNEGQEKQEAQRQPGRIAPQDAERILDALERKEQDTQDKVRAKLRPVRRVPIDKDW